MLIPLQAIVYCIVLETRSDGIDYTVVCFMTHDCSRKLWKQYQRELNAV